MKTTEQQETEQQQEDRIVVDILHRDFYEVYEQIVTYINENDLKY